MARLSSDLHLGSQTGSNYSYLMLAQWLHQKTPRLQYIAKSKDTLQPARCLNATIASTEGHAKAGRLGGEGYEMAIAVGIAADWECNCHALWDLLGPFFVTAFHCFTSRVPCQMGGPRPGSSFPRRLRFFAVPLLGVLVTWIWNLPKQSGTFGIEIRIVIISCLGIAFASWVVLYDCTSASSSFFALDVETKLAASFVFHMFIFFIFSSLGYFQ